MHILIPAAGASSRMRGRDKLTEEIGGLPLLRRSVSRALQTGAPVVVTLPPAPHPRHGALAGLDVTRVEVPDASDGISASLRRGLAALPADVPAVMILLPDLPDLTPAHFQRVVAAQTAAPDALAWRGSTDAGAPGHPVILSRSLIEKAATLTGDDGFAPLLKGLGANLCLVPLPGDVARTDLDTPEAWAVWRARQV